MSRGHLPIRTCVGCRQSGPKPTMARFSLALGRLMADPRGVLGGRGGYLHREPSCLDAFLGRKSFVRSLRASVDLVERSRFVSELGSAAP